MLSSTVHFPAPETLPTGLSAYSPSVWFLFPVDVFVLLVVLDDVLLLILGLIFYPPHFTGTACNTVY